MRYHFEKPAVALHMYGIPYLCDHPLYSMATLYLIGDKGLCVVQQRCKDKMTWWGEIDQSLTDVLYLNGGFKEYFDKYAKKKDENGLFPTVTIRQIMWGLKMKPLPREPWETYFDHAPI